MSLRRASGGALVCHNSTAPQLLFRRIWSVDNRASADVGVHAQIRFGQPIPGNSRVAEFGRTADGAPRRRLDIAVDASRNRCISPIPATTAGAPEKAYHGDNLRIFHFGNLLCFGTGVLDAPIGQ